MLGVVVTAAGGARLYVARQRLNRLKDLVTARAARDLVARTTTAGLDFAAQGLAVSGEAISRVANQVAGRLFRRGQTAGTGPGPKA